MAANWPYIKRLYEAGAEPAEISLQLGGRPSATIITRKLNAESWVRLPQTINTDPRSKDSPQKREIILSNLREGATRKMAAAQAGVSYDTLLNWCKDDPEFRLATEIAAASFAKQHLDNVSKAGQTDWKASSWLLQQHPTTKQDFSPAQIKGQGGINIVLNIPRSNPEAQGLREVFDSAPKLGVTEGELIEASASQVHGQD